MTFEILESNKTPNRYRRNPQFMEQYHLLDIFYEHKHNTVGFDFTQKDLRAFIKKHHKDPTTTEKVLPKNWSDDLADALLKQQIVAFKVLHKPFEDPIIKKNYSRFEVYIKK